MDIHKNARLTRRARERLAKIVLSGQMPQAVGRGNRFVQALCACPGRRNARQHRRQYGVLNFDRIASDGTGAGHRQINQLRRAPATSFRRCKHKLQLLRKAGSHSMVAALFRASQPVPLLLGRLRGNPP